MFIAGIHIKGLISGIAGSGIYRIDLQIHDFILLFLGKSAGENILFQCAQPGCDRRTIVLFIQAHIVREYAKLLVQLVVAKCIGAAVEIEILHCAAVQIKLPNQALPVIVAFNDPLKHGLCGCTHRPIRIVAIYLLVTELICNHHRAGTSDGCANPVLIAVHLVAHQGTPFVGCIKRLVAGQGDVFIRVIVLRTIGNCRQLFSLGQEVIITNGICMKNGYTQYQYNRSCSRQIPLLQNTAEALIEHHTTDPEGEYSARDHAGNQADFRPKGHVNDHAQNAAAYHREDKAHHDVKPAKGKRAFSRFSFTHTVKRKAQHQSSQNGNDAWIPYKLSGTIEAFV